MIFGCGSRFACNLIFKHPLDLRSSIHLNTPFLIGSIPTIHVWFLSTVWCFSAKILNVFNTFYIFRFCHLHLLNPLFSMDTFQSYIYRCISLYLHPYQPWLSTVRPFSKNSETQKTCLSWWLWGRSPTPWKGWQCPATCCATRCCRRWSYCGWSRRCSWRIVPRWVSPRSKDFMGKLWEHIGKSWDIDKWRFMGNSTILIVAELWYLTVIFPNGKSTTWGICRDFLG